MKNEATKLVTESLLGLDFKTVVLAGKSYSVFQPTIKIICRGLKEWSRLDFELDKEKGISIADIPTNAPLILKGLAYFVGGEVENWEDNAQSLYEKWMNDTPSVLPREMYEASKTIIEILGVDDFFGCAILLTSVTKMAATPNS